MTPARLILAALLLVGCARQNAIPPPKPATLTTQYLSLGNESSLTCIFSVHEFEPHGVRPTDAFRRLLITIGTKDSREGFAAVFTRGDVFEYLGVPIEGGWALTLTKIRFGDFQQTIHYTAKEPLTPESSRSVTYVSYDPERLRQLVEAVSDQEITIDFIKTGTSEQESWSMPKLAAVADVERLQAFRTCIARFYALPPPSAKAT